MVNDEDDFVVDDAIKELYDWPHIKKFIFMINDGLGFWGTDVTKLDRLKNKPYHKEPGWFDKFFSLEYFITSAITLWVAISIIIYEIERIGTISTQHNTLVKKMSLTYEAE